MTFCLLVQELYHWATGDLTYQSFLEDSNFLSHTFHSLIKIAILLYLFHSESKHFDSSPSSISRMSVNGFSCAPTESAVTQLRNIWSGKIMDRSFGTLVHSWGFFQFTHPNPFSHPKKNNVGRTCICRNVSEYQLCSGWMKEQLQENFEKEDKQKVQKIMNAALLSPGILSRIVAARK